MVGQIVLCFPLLVAWSHAAIEAAERSAWETAITLGAPPWRAVLTLLHEVRFGLIAAVIAGFDARLPERDQLIDEDETEEGTRELEYETIEPRPFRRPFRDRGFRKERDRGFRFHPRRGYRPGRGAGDPPPRRQGRPGHGRVPPRPRRPRP